MPQGMLVVSRKADQKVIINGNIEVMVVGVSGKTVKLGTKAPPQIPVHRAEVWSQIEAEQSPSVSVPAELDGVTAVITKVDGQVYVDITSDRPVIIRENTNGRT